MKYCVSCNREYGDDYGFCIECGSTLINKEASIPSSAPMPSSAPAPTPVSAPAPEPSPAPQPTSQPAPQQMPSSGSGYPQMGYNPMGNNQQKSVNTEATFKGLLIAVCALGGILLLVGIFCLVCKLAFNESPLVTLGICDEFVGDEIDTDPIEVSFDSQAVSDAYDSDLPETWLTIPRDPPEIPDFHERGSIERELNYIIGTSSLSKAGTCSIKGQAARDVNDAVKSQDIGIGTIYKHKNGTIMKMDLTEYNGEINSSRRIYYGTGIMFVENQRADDGQWERIFFSDGLPFCYTCGSEYHTCYDDDWAEYYYRCCDFKPDQSYVRKNYQ